jgi:hypothetical protein
MKINSSCPLPLVVLGNMHGKKGPSLVLIARLVLNALFEELSIPCPVLKGLIERNPSPQCNVSLVNEEDIMILLKEHLRTIANSVRQA